MEDFSSLVSLEVESERDPRGQCPGCQRSQRVCLCPFLPSQPIKLHSHIIIIQHPKEALQLSIGSVNLVKKCLGPSCTVLVGLDFTRGRFSALDLAFDSPDTTLILFPGEGAISLRDLPPRGIADHSQKTADYCNNHVNDEARKHHVGGYTVVVVDGTWAQAKKLMTLNPHLRQLRKVYLDQKAKSEFLELRREPKEFFLSTLESVVQVLDILEPDRHVGNLAHETLMGAFRAMVRIEGSFVPSPAQTRSAISTTTMMTIRPPKATKTRRRKAKALGEGEEDLGEVLRELFERYFKSQEPRKDDSLYPKKEWIICQPSNLLDGSYSCQAVIEQGYFGTLHEMNNACKWVNEELGFNKGNKLSPLPASSSASSASSASSSAALQSSSSSALQDEDSNQGLAG